MTAHDWGALADDATAATVLEAALGVVDGKVDYADARLIECEELRSYAQRGADPDERIERNIGIGVRVLVDGQWGFAARPFGDVDDARAAAARALGSAVSLEGHGKPVNLPPQPPASGRYETRAATDPFAVSAEHRQELLADVAVARRARPRRSRPLRRASTPSGSTAISPAPRVPASTSTSSRPARC